MQQKISFRTWLSVLFGGIWQFIRGIFSWKNKTPFWRVIWATFAVCLVIITAALSYEIYREISHDRRWTDNVILSPYMTFSHPQYSLDPGWVVNQISKEIVTKNIDWIVLPDDGDSLAVFASAGKRGFLNRYTGEIAIAPQFDRAWVFSSGLAAVANDGKVFFIDRTGKAINDKTFPYKPRNDYAYHGDYCAMNNDVDLIGLIDRDGNWKVEPQYEWFEPAPRNYWKMRKGEGMDGIWYAYNDKGELVNELGTTNLDISEDLGVVYTLPNHLNMVVDFDGNRLEKFLCHEIEPMYYDTDQVDENNAFIRARCTLYRYRMADGHEGLCRENGTIITEPLYWNVTPVGKDLYLCTYRDAGVGVIINSKGEITE